MKPRQLILFVILISSLFVKITSAQEIDSAAIKKLSKDFFTYMNDNNFKEAAKLFHYPPDYSKAELQNDITAVSKLLDLYSSELGNATLKDTTMIPTQIIHVSVGGGDMPYWSKQPTLFSMNYPVIFDKEGFGFVNINFCYINNKCEIREVFYALPQSRDGAELRMRKIMIKMFQLHQQIQTEKASEEI